MFIAVLFTIAKCWKQPKCPSVTEWIKKLWYRFPVKMEVYVDKLCLLTQPQKELQLNLKQINAQNFKKIKLYGSPATKDLTKPQSSRRVRGAQTRRGW